MTAQAQLMGSWREASVHLQLKKQAEMEWDGTKAVRGRATDRLEVSERG